MRGLIGTLTLACGLGLSVACGGLGRSRVDVQGPAVDVHGSPTTTPGECSPVGLELAWPLDGQVGRDWVVNNYVDLDPTDKQVKDFQGEVGEEAATYDGHDGVDISIASFRWMDRGIPVHAVAPGKVVQVRDGNADRNTGCPNYDWNVIVVELANGLKVTYGHLRKGSLTVALGDQVQTGDVLALLGSSGCSDEPHLHVELTGCGGARIPPFQAGVFASPPPYRPPPSVLEGYVIDGWLRGNDLDPIKRAPANLTRVTQGQPITVAVAVGNLNKGQRTGVRLRGPRGKLIERERSMERRFTISYWYWLIDAPEPGTWTVEFWAEQAEPQQAKLQVAAKAAGKARRRNR